MLHHCRGDCTLDTDYIQLRCKFINVTYNFIMSTPSYSFVYTQAFPCCSTSTYTRKSRTAWSIWWCNNWMWFDNIIIQLRVSAYIYTHTAISWLKQWPHSLCGWLGRDTQSRPITSPDQQDLPDFSHVEKHGKGCTPTLVHEILKKLTVHYTFWYYGLLKLHH